ncbi:MAG: deoxyribose-phosphate aldolase [Candidatus Micrarchaeaceae archaeon]
MSLAEDAPISAEGVMRLVDHTLLKPYAGMSQIDAFVKEASSLGVYSVCIQPLYAERVRELINSNCYGLRLAVVVDFPHGSLDTGERISVIRSLKGIADEIDAVMQVGLAKSGRFEDIREDLGMLAEEAHGGKMKLKVITEDAYLIRAEKEKAYEAVFGSGADFIKTSTGFAEPQFSESIGNRIIGADLDNVRLMAEVSERMGKQDVGIKVAGGIKTLAQVMDFLKVSGRKADPNHFRVGTSSSKAIYEELKLRHLPG